MDISTSSAYAGADPSQTRHMLAYVAEGSPIGITTDAPDISTKGHLCLRSQELQGK
jgi:hypothetical protein